jgi:magnesium chelatase family protein
LAPADIKKEGPSFDLPMAIGILLADKQLEKIPEFDVSLFIGELSLDGRLRQLMEFCRLLYLPRKRI